MCCLSLPVMWANECLIEREAAEALTELEHLFRNPPTWAPELFLLDGIDCLSAIDQYANQRLRSLWQRKVCDEC